MPQRGTAPAGISPPRNATPRVDRRSIRDRVGDWLLPSRGAESDPVVLGQRRVYILPSGPGLMFGLTLFLILIGAINYNLSLAYLLAFLLMGSAVVSMLHCWRNLARIALRPGKSAAVFAGDFVNFRIYVENPGRIDRVSLALQWHNHPTVYFDSPAGTSRDVLIALPSTRRGLLRPGRFRIFTTYPLGLFYAWANVELDLSCLVYPQPEPGKLPLPPAQPMHGEGRSFGIGAEDFAGLRTFHRGDSPRHIAWKAFARNDVLLAKQFSGSAAPELWLNFADLPDSLGPEGKISRLTRWVLDIDARGQRFGLRLPGTVLEVDAGAAHRNKCLQALALFELSDT